MGIGRRIKQARELRGLTQKQLGDLVGVTGSAITNYESGVSHPKEGVLYRLMAELSVDANFLFQDCAEVPDAPQPDELELISKFRVLDGHGRELVSHVLDSEYRRVTRPPEAASDKPATKIIPLYRTPAAAGYASPAQGEDYDELEVPAGTRGDFAVKIAGDSMEPYISDGSTVFVTRQLDLISGDVGMFFVDGNMLCKQYCLDSFGNIYLFSLNRARADADVTIWASGGVTICCYGKVVLRDRPPLPRGG